MSINKVKSVKKAKAKGMYEVSINDTIYKVSEDTIVKYILTKDKILSDDELTSLQSSITFDNIYQKVIKYITFQMRSEYEVVKYLEKLNCDENTINEIVNKLKSIKLIDDLLLEQYILSSSINSLKGPKYFYQKLKTKGIENTLSYDYDLEEITVSNCLNKIHDKYSKYPISKQKMLLKTKLIRDGFSSSVASKHVNKLSLTDNFEETLQKDYQKLLRKYDNLDEKQKNIKILTSLQRKGYPYKDIKNILK